MSVGCNCCTQPLPVSPVNPIGEEEVDGTDHAYERPEDAEVEVAKGDAQIDTEEILCGPCEGDDSVIRPRLLPSPKAPTEAEIEIHNTTHLPYRNWCPWCVAGRRNNTAHRELGNKHDRAEPCLHLDCAFLSDEVGSANLTVLIGKLEYPKSKLDEQNSTFACPVGEKGAHDPYAFNQLKGFIRMHGVRHLVFKSDQEKALIAAIELVASDLRKEGLTMVLEHSPVGESQSNGVAERQVQAVEDLIRTMRGALMNRLQCRIAATHPLFQWLVCHAASVMNRYVVGRDGRTAFQRLHGRRASSKAVEFGERVFYYIPKKLRAKMSLRWRLGMYLGVAAHSGEHLIGTWSGDVVRTRSIVRRWKREPLLLLPSPAWRAPCGAWR